MAKAVSSSLNGAGATGGSYASNGLPAVLGTAVPVTVTFQADPQNRKSDQNK